MTRRWGALLGILEEGRVPGATVTRCAQISRLAPSQRCAFLTAATRARRRRRPLVEPALSVAAALAGRSPLLSPPFERRAAVLDARRALPGVGGGKASGPGRCRSDHTLLAAVARAYAGAAAAGGGGGGAHGRRAVLRDELALSRERMDELEKTRRQLAQVVCSRRKKKEGNERVSRLD
jgi:hypothetical protein